MAVVESGSGSTSNAGAKIIVTSFLTFFVLLVLVVVGPSVVASRRRGMQKKATSEVVSISKLVEAYKKQTGHCPKAGNESSSDWQFVPVGQIREQLKAAEHEEPPTSDPWGTAYVYGYNPKLDGYCVMSLGSNGKMETLEMPKEFKGTHCFESDIISYNGSLVQASEGGQKNCGHGDPPD